MKFVSENKEKDSKKEENIPEEDIDLTKVKVYKQSEVENNHELPPFYINDEVETLILVNKVKYKKVSMPTGEMLYLVEQDVPEEDKLSLRTELLIERQEKQLTKEAKEGKPKPKKKIHIRKDASELVVISRARDLVKYVVNASRKIPKSERYTFATRVQGLALDMISNMVRANTIVVRPKKIEQFQKRYEFQEKAQCDLKVLEYIVAIAVEDDFMTIKQYQQIAKQSAEVSILLTRWIDSDRRRFLANLSQ